MGNKNINVKTSKGTNMSTVGVDIGDWVFEKKLRNHSSHGPVIFRFVWETFAFFFLARKQKKLLIFFGISLELGISVVNGNIMQLISTFCRNVVFIWWYGEYPMVRRVFRRFSIGLSTYKFVFIEKKISKMEYFLVIYKIYCIGSSSKFSGSHCRYSL